MAKKLKQFEKPFYILVFLLFFLFFLIFLKNFFVNYLWFSSLGYLDRFLKEIRLKALVFLGFGSFSFLGLLANQLVIRQSINKRQRKSRAPLFVFQSVISIIIASFVFAIIPAQWWEEILNFLNAVKFHVRDPLFQADIGFFVFRLPLLQFLRAWCFFFVLFLLVWSFLYYYFAGCITFSRFKLFFPDRIRLHAGVLLFLLFINLSLYYYLDRFALLFSQGPVIKGASYADIRGALPFLNVFSLFFLVTAFLALYWVRRPRGVFPVFILGVFLVLGLLSGIVPFFIQQFIVNPARFAKERPYIENTIRFTRMAYQLDTVNPVSFVIKDAPSPGLLQEEELFSQLRIWEYRQIRFLFNRLQSFKPYYLFYNVDVDRYPVKGQLTQVMIAGREISRDNLPPHLRNWVNRYLRYTHGYGVVVAEAGSRDQEGLPAFLVRDIPLTLPDDLKLVRPEIYFGEVTRDYVIVRTRVREFHYPSVGFGGSSVYQGEGGVLLDGFWKKLLMALHLPDLRVLFSPLITKKSRAMIKRNIVQRVKSLVPFLVLDNDPYLVVARGKLYWLMDAYTVTDQFPYSEMSGGGYNYIRNSVKIIIDAYTGKVNLYVVDSGDPLIRSRQKAFPGLFKSAGMIPPELKEHFRYPPDLFMIQAEMFSSYHGQNAEAFFNNEDLWEIPSEILDEEENLINGYYLIHRLPGDKKHRFYSMLPFKASRRDFLTGALFAESDSRPQGRLSVCLFSNREAAWDMLRVNRAISEDRRITEFVMFWDQKGYKVINGNLLMVPVAGSILYLQPLFVYSEKFRMTELKKIILSLNGELLLCDDVREGLKQIVSGRRNRRDDYKKDIVRKIEAILEKMGRDPARRTQINELKLLLEQMK